MSEKLTEAEMARAVACAERGSKAAFHSDDYLLTCRALLQQSEALAESERRIQELEAVCVGHNTRARSWQLQSEKLAGEKGAAEAQVAALEQALEQSRRFIHIGGLLDAWDAMPNDLKSDIEDSAAGFSRRMEMLNAAMEGLDTWNRRAEQEGGKS